MSARLIQETVGYADACKMLECGKNKILELCENGELASTIHAGRRRIFTDSIEDYSKRIREKAYREAEKRRNSA